jgi:hypothetical protein
MSILAGILNRRRDVPLAISLCDELSRLVSRDARDDVLAFRDRNVALFKVDVGAYGEPGHRFHGSGSVSMLAGEPLLDLGLDPGSGDRASDLERLHDAFDRQDWALFAKTQGVYCAVHYDPGSATASLVADRLAIRPLYYWMGQDYVVFSSALRVVEGLSVVPKTMDLVAVTEMVMLGAPIGSRTAFAEIHALTAGEIVQVTPDRARSYRYWRWDTIEPSSRTHDANLDEAYSRFRKAVRRRLGRDSAVIATLSGGLDSRCVVAALRTEAVAVHTLNFYDAIESQDQVFAAEFARQAGTIHRAVAVSGGDILRAFEQRVVDTWRASPPSSDVVPERPRLLWKGDGGSVGVGHVFVQPDIVAALRAGELEIAIRAYRSRLTPRLLKDGLRLKVTELVEEDIRTELGSLRFDDPGRSFHMFLMLYEQRYNGLAQHFEDVDLHRLEFHLPFLDGDFLASIVAAPVDECLAHGFYNDWLSRFPPVVTAVAWQAYPGHRPCPLPIPAGLAYQWDVETLPAAEVEARRRELQQLADRLLATDQFPDAILDKRLLQLTRWMGRVRLQRGQATIRAAEVYERYWTASGGRFVAEPAASVEH